MDKNALLLYAVTDRAWLNGETLCEQVRKSLEGGATMVQLREKMLDEESFYREACEIKALCHEYNVPFIINDNVDIALRCDADGVHVGQTDMEAGNVREKLGPDKIIGVTCKTVEQALRAQAQGADYLGSGAMFPTGTKANAQRLSYEGLKEICGAVSIPVVAIGGITKDNLASLEGSGIAGIAVVSAIYAQSDIKAAAEDLKARTAKIVAK